MSSKRVQVSSGQQFSDNADPLTKTDNTNDLLSPAWSAYPQHKINKAKSTCGVQTKKNSEVDQIQFYKEKAHQSFMQVIQVQQLHEQQIEQLKQQYQNQIQSLKRQLSQKNQMIEVLEKNSKHHMLQFQKTLQIQGLELIQCRQANLTKFDQSSILNFKQILNQKQGDIKIQSMKDKVFQAISEEISRNFSNLNLLNQNIKKQVTGVFEYIKEVRYDLLCKIDSYEDLLKRYEQIDLNHKKLKAKFDGIQSDTALMSQSLRKVNSDKLNLEKKMIELQKQLKTQYNSQEGQLKVSLKQTTNSPVYSTMKHIVNQKKLLKSASNRLQPYKSHRQFQDKSSNLEQGEEDEFIEKNKQKTSFKAQKNDESFDMKDLMAQMNQSSNIQESKILNGLNQKKSQLFVPTGSINRTRKRSFDN